MTLVAERTYTPQDLLSDPNLAGFELVDGHLVERPVSEQSSLIGSKINYLLRHEADKTREAMVYQGDLGYQCFPEFPGTVRFPDVSLVRASRRNEIGENPGYMPIPADLAVEVLSPNDRIKNIDEKVEEYLDAGFESCGSSVPIGGTSTSIAARVPCNCFRRTIRSPEKQPCRAFDATWPSSSTCDHFAAFRLPLLVLVLGCQTFCCSCSSSPAPHADPLLIVGAP